MQRETMHRLRFSPSTVTVFFVLLFVGGIFALSAPLVAHAAGVDVGLTSGVESALGLGTQDIRVTIASIIRAFLALLGIVAVVIILYGGFVWMTSQGDTEKVDTARKIITNGVIGLAIILSAMAITQFTIQALTGAGGGGNGGPGGRGGAGGSGAGGLAGGGFGSGGFGSGGASFSVPFSGSLGNGIVQYHTPARGAVDVPRNTRISITFREPVAPDSLIAGYDDNGTPDDLTDDYPDPASVPQALNADVVQIYPTSAGEDSALTGEQVQVSFSGDGRTFVLEPPVLGNAAADTTYTVHITSALRTRAGAPAMSGAFAGGYAWEFTVGSFVDDAPPYVVSVVPRRDVSEPRNTVIQVTFNEPIDPTSVGLGTNTHFRVTGAADAPVDGSVSLVNGNRTLEFVSSTRCGSNACGASMYCLPADAALTVTVVAASVGSTPPAANPDIYPPDGITDLSGNALDGNGDGQSSGPGNDNYVSRFRTSAAIDTTAPVIEQVTPNIDAAEVAADADVTVRFSKRMSLRTFTSQNMPLHVAPTPSEPTCFSWYGQTVDDTGVVVDDGTKTEAVLRHCLFAANTSYIPEITSAVTDVHQNCYAPAATTASFGQCSTTTAFCCNGVPSTVACTVSESGAVTPGR